MKVFISYSKKDSEFVEILKNKLLSSNIITLTVPEHQVGSAIFSSIEKMIKQADMYIVVVSKSFLESSWSDIELFIITDQALGRRGNKKIFPIIIEKGIKVPTLLSEITYADYSDPKTWEIDIEKFVNDVEMQSEIESVSSIKSLDHILKEREKLLKIQELEYNLNRDSQESLRKVYKWFFLIVSIMSLCITIAVLNKNTNFKKLLEEENIIQNSIFYLLGVLTALVPSLLVYFKYKRKSNAR